MGQQNRIQITQQPTPALSVDNDYLLPLFLTTEAPSHIVFTPVRQHYEVRVFLPSNPAFQPDNNNHDRLGSASFSPISAVSRPHVKHTPSKKEEKEHVRLLHRGTAG